MATSHHLKLMGVCMRGAGKHGRDSGWKESCEILTSGQGRVGAHQLTVALITSRRPAQEQASQHSSVDEGGTLRSHLYQRSYGQLNK